MKVKSALKRNRLCIKIRNARKARPETLISKQTEHILHYAPKNVHA